MKFFTTAFFALCFAAIAHAQLPDGATAPNFTAKDLSGRSWNLYEILNTGRPVIMDVSATWCGPCWSYHTSHALENLWATHGPEGDGQVMVFFCEGDAATNLNCLYDLPGCDGGTQGDWTAGTPYPIFDNATISNNYQVGYFPTVYKICPDKKVYEVGQIDEDALWSSVQPCLGNVAPNSATVSNLVGGSLSTQICAPQTAHPKALITNLGSSPLTSAVLELKWNDQTIETKNWSGHLNAFEQQGVEFNTANISGAGVLSVKVTTANASANPNTTTSSVTYAQAPKVLNTQQVILFFQTDQNGKDIFWEALDENGNVLKHGGNEAVGPNGGGQFVGGSPSHPTAYADLTLVKDTISIPANSCLSLRVVDGQGNGLSSPGRYKLYNVDTPNTPFFLNAPYTSVGSNTFAPKTTGTDELINAATLNLFPVPASEELNVEFSLLEKTKVSIFVADAAGKVVFSENKGQISSGMNQIKFPVNTLAEGLYFLTLQTEAGKVVKKFTVVK